MGIGAPELAIVLVILLLLFGAKKVPDLASSMGRSIKEFRKASEGLHSENTISTSGSGTDEP